MNRIKRMLRDDLWVVLLDIVAVNLSYFLALVLRAAIDNLGVYGADGISQFFTLYYKFAPIYANKNHIKIIITFKLFIKERKLDFLLYKNFCTKIILNNNNPQNVKDAKK